LGNGNGVGKIFANQIGIGIAIGIEKYKNGTDADTEFE